MAGNAGGARRRPAGPARPDPQRRARRPRRQRARPRWSRRCSPRTGTITRAGRVEDGTTVCDHEDVEHRSARSVSLALASARARGREGQPARHPRLTPTSSASCGPGCGPRTPRCSSSRPWTASTARPGCSGRSAPPSACRAPSWSPSSTSSGPTSTRPSRSASACSARACCRSTCRCPPTTEAPAGLIGLLSQRVFDYSGGTRVERDARRRAPAAHRGAPATR